MWKRIWEKLKNPSVGLLVAAYVLTLLFCGWSLASLAIKLDELWFEIITYVSYAIAAITLTYTTYTLICILPKTYKNAKAKLQKIPFVAKLMENYGLRTIIFAAFSTLVTLAYSVYNAVICVIYHSMWYGALAGYYVLLLIMRGGIVLYHGRHRGRARKLRSDLGKYLRCGISLTITILALSVAIMKMVADGAAFEHPGLMIYVAATYTFYKITMSIINFVRAKKQDDYTVDALRNVNVADSAVSLLALQTSMIRTFSEGGLEYMNAITGAAVCAVVLGLGVYMIVRASLAFKRLKTDPCIENTAENAAENTAENGEITQENRQEYGE